MNGDWRACGIHCELPEHATCCHGGGHKDDFTHKHDNAVTVDGLRWRLNETLSALAEEHGIAAPADSHDGGCEVCTTWRVGRDMLRLGTS